VIGASYERFRTDFRQSDEEITGTTHMWNLFESYDFDALKLHLRYGQVRGAHCEGWQRLLVSKLQRAMKVLRLRRESCF